LDIYDKNKKIYINELILNVACMDNNVNWLFLFCIDTGIMRVNKHIRLP